ncbi:MAG TPA: response regulator [Bacteroidales bacterium]|nr:response regulator [Bacteroidales bacterium]
MGLTTNYLDFSGKNIVIVEDDIPSIKYYETILKNCGAIITILRSGLEFIEYIKQEEAKIDFIFMDFLIPFINGLDCTRIFRKTNKDTPLIMLTAYSSEQTKTEAYVAGCNEYVLKPIYCEKLLFLLDKYLIQQVHVTIRN